MSLTKLLRMPYNLFFKKDVISFLLVRRYDLKVIDDTLRYISVKPSASLSVLRQKIWHLLDLPDYCDETIVLKNQNDLEIPLIELRHGNCPQHPYILEVWSPGQKNIKPTAPNNAMLTLGEADADESISNSSTGDSISEEKIFNDRSGKFATNSNSTFINDAQHPKSRPERHKRFLNHYIPSEIKKTNLANKISSSSIISRLKGRKSRDNFTNILLKMQNDLSTLSTKISSLENRIS